MKVFIFVNLRNRKWGVIGKRGYLSQFSYLFIGFLLIGVLLEHSHSIYVFETDSRLVDWRLEIYNKIIQYVIDGYAVAYVGEENKNKVIQQFSKMGIPVEDYIDKGMLAIIDRDVFYSPFIPSKILLEQWNKLYASMKKNGGKNDSFKGFVAIGMPAESFFLSEYDRVQLVHYESTGAENYDGTIEAMCLYTTKMLEMMTLSNILELVNAHQNTAHREGKLREWNVSRALSILQRGFGNALGSGVADMVLEILIRDFEGNKESLVLKPDELERKISILLGQKAADMVINHIKRELTKDIIF